MVYLKFLEFAENYWNLLPVDNAHEIHTFFSKNLGKMLQKLLSAAGMIGALRVICLQGDDNSPRSLLRKTKKMGCQAKIVLKTVIEFPDYKVSELFFHPLFT